MRLRSIYFMLMDALQWKGWWKRLHYKLGGSCLLHCPRPPPSSASLNPSIFWSLPSNLNSFLVAYFLTNTTNVLFTCSAKGAFTDVQTSCFIFVFEFCIFLCLYHYICICICMIIPQLVEDGRAGQADARRLQTRCFFIVFEFCIFCVCIIVFVFVFVFIFV